MHVDSPSGSASLFLSDWGLQYLVLGEEGEDVFCDDVAVLFQHEVTSVQQVELQVVEVALVRMRASRWEDLIFVAPDDERGGWCFRM